MAHGEVFFLTTGTLVVPAFAVRPRGQWRGRCTLSVTVAVMVRPGGDLVLVDAGFSRATCADPRGELGFWYGTALGVRARPGDAIADQLEALGLPARSVKTIVASHLHYDHIGGAVDFPAAELVTSARELAAHRRGGLGYRAVDLAGRERVRTVALDGGPALGFPASCDLFGDGSVVLLDARGHTDGHLATALRERERLFVHTGDAADQTWEYGVAPAGPSLQGRLIARDVGALRATHAALRACEDDPGRPVLVPAHDHEVLGRLPRAPRGAIPS